MNVRGNSVITGSSAAIREVVALIDRVAESDCGVLIEGESGTGKELVARRLHERSLRNDKPFIPVNCAGISASLFESQFFGHLRGAFTGAEQASLGLIRCADSGTLFLDEVGDIPLDLQPKLLRVLQDGQVMAVGSTSAVPVNTRFIAATNRNLRQHVEAGLFREDLFYRLNIVRILVPPLRSRPGDVGELLEHFIALCAHRYRRPPIELPAAVVDQLSQYPWPGNVRELVNWVERLYATQMDAAALAASLVSHSRSRQGPSALLTLENAQRQAISNALRACDNNRSMAARILGVNRGTLIRKIAEYQIA